MKTTYAFFFLGLTSILSFSQNKIVSDIQSSEDLKTFTIQQTITFDNTSGKAMETIYFYNWLNAFSDKESPLAKRYAQDYVRRFHFASVLKGVVQKFIRYLRISENPNGAMLKGKLI